MKIIKSLNDFLSLRASEIFNGKQLGLVHTMGNLHEGHESLIKRCKKENDISILCNFINPTQFNDKKDLENYPKTLEHDTHIAQKNGIDYFFLPTFEELYPDNFYYQVTENNLSLLMEGQHRPGHFTGMLTIVLKVLNIVRPNRSYYGEKDYQQLALIQGMKEALFLNLEIIGCKTIRDNQGLALSSRNQLLSEEDKTKAHLFSEFLKKSLNPIQIEKLLTDAGFGVEYIADYQGRRYGAVKLGSVRLIDNIELVE